MGVNCAVFLPWSLFLSISIHIHAHAQFKYHCVPLWLLQEHSNQSLYPTFAPLYFTSLEQSFRKWLLWLLYSKPSTHSKFTVLNQSLKFLTPSGLWPLLITFLLLLTVPLRLASLPALPPIKNSLTSGTCFACAFPSLLPSSSDTYMTYSLFTSRSPWICVLIQESFLDQANKNNP